MENRTYYYARVSTKEQNLDRQIDAFKSLGANDREIIVDKESGKNLDRAGYARPEDIPDRTLFFIMTDGMENASVHCDLASVKSKIERQREKYGWDFIFLAANIDTFEAARSMGIKTEHAVRFEQTSEGLDSCFDDIMCIMRKIRKNEELDAINWTCEKK